MKKKIFNLTPLGRADQKTREFLEEKTDTDQFQKYNKTLSKYRNIKIIQQTTRVLLYASVITSVAATFNFNLSIINQIASYIGFTLLILIYTSVTYLAMIRQEEYYVQREILISTVQKD